MQWAVELQLLIASVLHRQDGLKWRIGPLTFHLLVEKGFRWEVQGLLGEKECQLKDEKLEHH